MEKYNVNNEGVFPTGGVPIHVDDIGKSEFEIYSVLTNLLQGFRVNMETDRVGFDTNPISVGYGFIISGMEFSLNTIGITTYVSYTDGYVFLDMDVLKVTADTFEVTGQSVVYWVKETTNESRTMNNGSTAVVKVLKTAVMSDPLLPLPPFPGYMRGVFNPLVADVPVISDAWNTYLDILVGRSDASVTLVDNTNWEIGVVNVCSWAHDRVYVDVEIKNITGSTSGTILTIPNGYRHPLNYSPSVIYSEIYSSSGDSLVISSDRQTGNVQVSTGTPTNGDFYMIQFQYFKN